MAITKRMRYEILRRDNHACRYCGGVAPDVVLTVDHVVPKALGGRDEPANLVAACHNCNAGKTSSAPDQHVVADVKDAAVKWSAAIALAADEARSDASGREHLYQAVIDAWPNFHRHKIPKDYSETIDQFLDAGLPHELIIEMAQLAGAKPSIYNRWAYFCGCCWTKIRQLQDRAIQILEAEADCTTTSHDDDELTDQDVAGQVREVWRRIEAILGIGIAPDASSHYPVKIWSCDLSATKHELNCLVDDMFDLEAYRRSLGGQVNG